MDEKKEQAELKGLGITSAAIGAFHPSKNGKYPISCDQVAWLLDIFERYLPKENVASICRRRDMMKYAMLYEVMEVATLFFEDDSARWNGTPNDARNYNESKLM